MDSVGLIQNGDCIEDTTSENLLSVDFPDSCDVFGEQVVFPRVGDEYQVEIPPLITESEFLAKNPIDDESRARVPFNFLIGLPLPLMWTTNKVKNLNNEMLESHGGSNDGSRRNGPLESEIFRETEFYLNDKDLPLSVELSDPTMDRGIGIGELASLGLADKMHPYRGIGYYLVPGSVGESWSDIERESFLLGLYIFEKNFVQVKRFIESKEMGDVLSFYYGKFYMSNEYRRWMECRKMKGRKSAYGPRIFTGLRQHELLSRLFLHVSEQCKNALLEVTKIFGEGKMSLHEYVSSLKAMVGMKILVEAVAIGKGKHDLTCIALEPSKANHVIPMRQEIPIGKACSSLSPSEIIKFLTGDYRLSKARSNDLFWEAVWPRLLARGWHSEQPKDHSYAGGSKHSLVFLMPGVKKFSRRRLVKGKDYFDSLTDVLSKVASEPGILKLDIEDEGNRSNGHYEWSNKTKMQQDDSPQQKRHFYLQPRTPNRITDGMKFTIVDTSLAYEKPMKVRELRTLPFEFSENLSPRSHSEDSDDVASDVSTNESDTAVAMLLDQEETNNALPTYTIPERQIFEDRKDLEVSALNQESPSNRPNFMNEHVNSSKNLCPPNQKLNQESLEFLAPTAKRHRRLTTCNHAETSRNITIIPMVTILEQEVCSHRLDNPDSTENVILQLCLSQDKLSSTSSTKPSPIETVECSPTENCHGAEHLHEKQQPRPLIDLNIPQVPLDFESGIFMTEATEGKDEYPSGEPNEPCVPKTTMEVASSEQQLNQNSRRQSTRNRPPTTRALEAIANGFLTVNQRRKRKEGGTRASRCPRGGIGCTESSTTDTVASNIERGNGVYNGGTSNMLSQYQVHSEGKESQDSGP